MTWNTHTATAELNASIEDVFRIYRDMRNHPRWSPWLVQVDWIDVKKQISQWTLKKFGVTLKWKAINEVVQPPNKISWKAFDGNVQHAGNVVFKAVSPNVTSVVLQVSYKVPKIVSYMFKASWIDNFVISTLKADMLRFNELLMEGVKDINLPEMEDIRIEENLSFSKYELNEKCMATEVS